jgi:hypothetical protein
MYLAKYLPFLFSIIHSLRLDIFIDALKGPIGVCHVTMTWGRLGGQTVTSSIHPLGFVIYDLRRACYKIISCASNFAIVSFKQYLRLKMAVF